MYICSLKFLLRQKCIRKDNRPVKMTVRKRVMRSRIPPKHMRKGKGIKDNFPNSNQVREYSLRIDFKKKKE